MSAKNVGLADAEVNADIISEHCFIQRGSGLCGLVRRPMLAIVSPHHCFFLA